MSTESISTLPKPFVFVLMPFDARFHDIYKFGIQGAAADVGAYAERVDEQIFIEGILDRIFNQVSKADIIVADMTGRNPNVFYEVGYAHALNKVVLLLTQEAEDIPFDLKHRAHIVYSGKIDLLRQQLASRLAWAITEARRANRSGGLEKFGLRIQGEYAAIVGGSAPVPLIKADPQGPQFVLLLELRNDSPVVTSAITHVYLFWQAGNAPETARAAFVTDGSEILHHQPGSKFWPRPADSVRGSGARCTRRSPATVSPATDVPGSATGGGRVGQPTGHAQQG